MKRKGLLFLVLATLVAGGAFAQKAGDTGDFMGKNYTVKEIRNGEVILILTPTLDGTWQINAGVTAYTFNGNAAVYKQIAPSGITGSALTKGLVKIGDQAVRNLKKTNDLTWNCQVRSFTANTNAPNVCTGTNWVNCTIKLNPDGKSFQLYSGDVAVGQSVIYNRQ